MKKILTALLTAALVGSLMFAGAAGTAAAHDKDDTEATAIDTITFYNDDDGDLEQFAKATWNGDQFVIEKLDGNDDISLTVKEYNEDGPVKVEWTYEGYVGADYPDFVRVNAGGQTCDFAVDSTTYPFTGTVTACDLPEDTDGDDSDDKHDDDKHGDDKHGDDKHDDDKHDDDKHSDDKHDDDKHSDDKHDDDKHSDDKHSDVDLIAILLG